MSNRLDERIRSLMQQVVDDSPEPPAGPVAPPAAPVAPPVRPISKRNSPSWVVATASAAAVIVLIGGVAWLLAGTGGDVVDQPVISLVTTTAVESVVPIEPLPSPDAGGATILDVDGLIAELRIAGATVDLIPREPGEDGFRIFAGETVGICVNGGRILLYEYPSQADRERDSNSIMKDGQFRGPGIFAIVDWVGRPRFFAGGRLIVLHLGEDQDTDSLLSNILGPTLSPDGVGFRIGTGLLACDNKPGDSSSARP